MHAGHTQRIHANAATGTHTLARNHRRTGTREHRLDGARDEGGLLRALELVAVGRNERHVLLVVVRHDGVNPTFLHKKKGKKKEDKGGLSVPAPKYGGWIKWKSD